jgi:hypothetical protein
MFFNCFFCSGVRTDLFAAKLPNFPSGQSVLSATWATVPVSLGPSSAYNQARVRFGYGENGNPANLYCTPRAESCVASSAAPAPYGFVTSDGPAWQTCSSGCTINVPAIPGRVLYYAVERFNSSTLALSTSSLQTVANP